MAGFQRRCETGWGIFAHRASVSAFWNVGKGHSSQFGRGWLWKKSSCPDLASELNLSPRRALRITKEFVVDKLLIAYGAWNPAASSRNRILRFRLHAKSLPWGREAFCETTQAISR